MRSAREKCVGALIGLVMCTAGTAVCLATGPDVIVGDLPDLSNYIPSAAETGFDAFSVGTTSCNIGDVPLNWFTGSTGENRHPVIGQNLFRYNNGRFEHIGQSWLKHGFTALSGSICSTCPPGSPSGTQLGVGCSDPYSSGLNGGQGGLGPKWEVNAATGIFNYPFTNSSGSGEMYKRLRVRTVDLDPATYIPASTQYFIEGQYIVGDDAAAGNKNNNASHRKVAFTQIPAATPPGTTPLHYDIAFVAGSPVQRQIPAVYEWRTIDPSVVITTADVPNDGRYILGCKVTSNGGSPATYTYEYALHNLNSDRCAGSFSVPLPAGATATSLGFHDVEYHSGEPNAVGANPASDDWSSAVSASSVTWSGASLSGSVAAYTLSGTPYKLAVVSGVQQWFPGTGNNHTANVLRWGTLFNFRFTSNTAPASGAVQIGLWRPGTPSTATFIIPTPGGATGGFPTTGSCCVGAVCSVVAAASCTGTFGTVGSTCTPDPCNLPTGACCQASGSCNVVAQGSCSGGSYLGNTTVCSPNPCPQPGANDSCANAIALCDGSALPGTTLGATPDGTASCAGTSGTGASVWYKYTPAAAGTSPVSVTIDTCSADYDTAISVWSGTCPGTTQVGCDDDGCGALHSSLAVNLVRGTTYLIRVAGYNGLVGNFTITATGGGGTCGGGVTGRCCNGGNCTVVTQTICGSGTWTTGGTCAVNTCAPFNDNCNNRVGITTGTVPFNNTYATTDGPTHAGCNFFSNNQIEKDLWYNFPSSFAGQLRVDTCGSSFDTKVAVYDDTGCTNFDARLLACNDDNVTAPPAGCGAGTLQSSVLVNVIAGRSYTIRVGSFGTTAAGPGSLNLTAIPTATNGACCDSSGACHDTATAAACTSAGGTFQGVGSVCTPNPCPPPVTGACCNGVTCSVGTQAACTGSYQGNSSACGAAGNPTTCCPANFNQSGGVTVQDIFDFLAAYFANSPNADFNHVGGLSVQDIFDFLSAYFTGCPG